MLKAFIRSTLLFLFLLPVPDTIGQTLIGGSIKDENEEAVIGANIFIEDTYDGTSSELDGTFQFSTEEYIRRISIPLTTSPGEDSKEDEVASKELRGRFCFIKSFIQRINLIIIKLKTANK